MKREYVATGSFHIIDPFLCRSKIVYLFRNIKNRGNLISHQLVPGFDTMRWTSRIALVCFLRQPMTGAPKVKFGTKWPSMTSKRLSNQLGLYGYVNIECRISVMIGS